MSDNNKNESTISSESKDKIFSDITHRLHDILTKDNELHKDDEKWRGRDFYNDIEDTISIDKFGKDLAANIRQVLAMDKKELLIDSEDVLESILKEIDPIAFKDVKDDIEAFREDIKNQFVEMLKDSLKGSPLESAPEIFAEAEKAFFKLGYNFSVEADDKFSIERIGTAEKNASNENNSPEADNPEGNTPEDANSEVNAPEDDNPEDRSKIVQPGSEPTSEDEKQNADIAKMKELAQKNKEKAIKAQATAEGNKREIHSAHHSDHFGIGSIFGHTLAAAGAIIKSPFSLTAKAAVFGYKHKEAIAKAPFTATAAVAGGAVKGGKALAGGAVKGGKALSDAASIAKEKLFKNTEPSNKVKKEFQEVSRYLKAESESLINEKNAIKKGMKSLSTKKDENGRDLSSNEINVIKNDLGETINNYEKRHDSLKDMIKNNDSSLSKEEKNEAKSILNDTSKELSDVAKDNSDNPDTKELSKKLGDMIKKMIQSIAAMFGKGKDRDREQEMGM